MTRLFRACDCYAVYCKHNPKREFKMVFPLIYKPTFDVHFTDQLIIADDGYKYHRVFFGFYTRGSRSKRYE